MAVIVLPAILDLKAVSSLKTEIQAHSGEPLELDASRTERFGGLCLQVLLAAAGAWRAAGQQFRLINVGEAFRRDARLLGAADLLPGLDEGTPQSC